MPSWRQVGHLTAIVPPTWPPCSLKLASLGASWAILVASWLPLGRRFVGRGLPRCTGCRQDLQNHPQKLIFQWFRPQFRFNFHCFFLLFVCFFVRAFLYSRASFFFILVCLFLRLLVCSFVCSLDYLLVVRWFRRSLWFACFLVVCLFVRSLAS